MQYIEGRGPEHRAQLADLLGQLQSLPACLGADLLSSPQQPGLCLLEIRWQAQPPPVTIQSVTIQSVTIPPGCKTWAFIVDDSWKRN